MKLTYFWHEVSEAYNQVAVNHEREIRVARDGKEAVIYYDDRLGICIQVKPAITQTVEPLASP